MEKNKSFNINVARGLLSVLQGSARSFLKYLIDYQEFFGEDSIIDCKLELSEIYDQKTVESVLADLGYKLVYYKSTKIYIIIEFS